jgi:hypothetical protein
MSNQQHKMAAAQNQFNLTPLILNASGAVNAADIAAVKARSVRALVQ